MAHIELCSLTHVVYIIVDDVSLLVTLHPDDDDDRIIAEIYYLFIYSHNSFTIACHLTTREQLRYVLICSTLKLHGTVYIYLSVWYSPTILLG